MLLHFFPLIISLSKLNSLLMIINTVYSELFIIITLCKNKDVPFIHRTCMGQIRA